MPRKTKRALVVEARAPRDLIDAIGSRLSYLRTAARLTQEELAAKCGVGAASLSRIENSKEKNPTLATLARIAAGLDIPVSDLVVGPSANQENPREASTAHPSIEKLIGTIDTDFPAEPSWRGDILQAIAILNRALRRDRAE